MRVFSARCSSNLSGLVLLAPAIQHVPRTFASREVNSHRHASLVAEVQRFRGSIYLDDGAIEPPQLSADGRHCVQADDASWHVVIMQADGRVAGCARYRVHPANVRPELLDAWTSPLARAEPWRSVLFEALSTDIAAARRQGLAYVEVGGWAIAPSRRYSQDAVSIALSTYALAAVLGGCIGVTTATTRHCSSRILGKLGGTRLDAGGHELPIYYDPQFRCEMELLRFDSRIANPAYASRIARLAEEVAAVPVLCRGPLTIAATPLGAVVQRLSSSKTPRRDISSLPQLASADLS